MPSLGLEEAPALQWRGSCEDHPLNDCPQDAPLHSCKEPNPAHNLHHLSELRSPASEEASTWLTPDLCRVSPSWEPAEL